MKSAKPLDIVTRIRKRKSETLRAFVTRPETESRNVARTSPAPPRWQEIAARQDIHRDDRAPLRERSNPQCSQEPETGVSKRCERGHANQEPETGVSKCCAMHGSQEPETGAPKRCDGPPPQKRREGDVSKHRNKRRGKRTQPTHLI